MGLKGDYVLNPDSLRLDFCDKNIKVGKSFPFSGTNTYKNNNTHVKNRIIAVKLRYERQGEGGEDTLALFVLPSDFLMCNEKRVLTDSLRIVFSHPLKTIFQHKACTDKLYADSFYKVQKNSYSSFEVICCRR